MTTAEVIAIFAKQMEEKKEEVSLPEMKKSLTEIYKKIITESKKKVKKTKRAEDDKSDNEEPKKKKREPTAYNIFMKEKMEEMKKEGSTLNGKEKMAAIAQMWREK